MAQNVAQASTLLSQDQDDSKIINQCIISIKCSVHALSDHALPQQLILLHRIPVGKKSHSILELVQVSQN